MTATEPLTDAEFKARFLDTTLGTDQFHHADHVHMAWLFVTDHGMPHALDRFPAALRRFADAKGATSLYHATITWAFLLLIHERQVRQPAVDWPAFAAANPDLLTWKPSILERLYTHDTLWSEFARRTFVLPDRLAASQTD